MAEQSENEPLLQECSVDKYKQLSVSDRTSDACNSNTNGSVHMKRTITLPYAIAIIVGNVIGSGIFFSPKGVTQKIGSVGGSLIIWALTGLYTLCQGLCYAELGVLIPRSGGDYTYLYYILGPVPAFMCMWINMAVVITSSNAAVARTAMTYFVEPISLQCDIGLITFLAIWLHGKLLRYTEYT